MNYSQNPLDFEDVNNKIYKEAHNLASNYLNINSGMYYFNKQLWKLNSARALIIKTYLPEDENDQ